MSHGPTASSSGLSLGPRRVGCPRLDFTRLVPNLSVARGVCFPSRASAHPRRRHLPGRQVGDRRDHQEEALWGDGALSQSDAMRSGLGRGVKTRADESRRSTSRSLIPTSSGRVERATYRIPHRSTPITRKGHETNLSLNDVIGALILMLVLFLGLHPCRRNVVVVNRCRGCDAVIVRMQGDVPDQKTLNSYSTSAMA